MYKKAEERRDQILRATFKAVTEKGYDSVTLQDIADYADVSKGVINYYFENKEDVFSHLLCWITEKIHKNERAAVNEKSGALNKLRGYVNAAFTSPKENKDFYRVYLDFLAQANHNNHFRKINYNFYNNCWALGREIVTEGQNEGIFANIDIEKATVTIRSMIDGCLIQWLMINNDELHDFYRNTCYESIANYLTNKIINHESS